MAETQTLEKGPSFNNHLTDDILHNTTILVAQLLEEIPSASVFLKEQHNIGDVMEHPLPNYKNVTDDNIIWGNVRGNTRLMGKSIMTYPEADQIIQKAMHFSVEQ